MVVKERLLQFLKMTQHALLYRLATILLISVKIYHYRLSKLLLRFGVKRVYLEGNYNYYMMALSLLIAILASYSALNITEKIPSTKGKLKYIWLFSGSVVMGCGIWSMHFIGMLAFHLPVAMQYDVGLTLILMLVSTAFSLVAFYIMMFKSVNRYKVL